MVCGAELRVSPTIPIRLGDEASLRRGESLRVPLIAKDLGQRQFGPLASVNVGDAVLRSSRLTWEGPRRFLPCLWRARNPRPLARGTYGSAARALGYET